MAQAATETIAERAREEGLEVLRTAEGHIYVKDDDSGAKRRRLAEIAAEHGVYLEPLAPEEDHLRPLLAARDALERMKADIERRKNRRTKKAV